MIKNKGEVGFQISYLTVKLIISRGKKKKKTENMPKHVPCLLKCITQFRDFIKKKLPFYSPEIITFSRKRLQGVALMMILIVRSRSPTWA